LLLALLVLALRPPPSLKMRTVSCALLIASRVSTTLKLREYMRASRVLRRNWYSFSAPGTPYTWMTVSFSEAVSRSVRVLLNASAEKGALCAQMIWETVRDLVEKSSTSPDAATAGDCAGGVCDEAETGVRTGTGEGYARRRRRARGLQSHKIKDVEDSGSKRLFNRDVLALCK
jgi:hypothetical protein